VGSNPTASAMGIKVEFNPDLALRNCAEFEAGRRKAEECIPKDMAAGKIFSFFKEGQRNYWLEGEIPLVETKGNQQLSRPLASIIILEAVHLLIDSKPYTKGRYEVVELFDQTDRKVHFDGFTKI
jgi:hypothetical protein